eukprot:5063991-Karenia_brevis.AAC.1
MYRQFQERGAAFVGIQESGPTFEGVRQYGSLVVAASLPDSDGCGCELLISTSVSHGLVGGRKIHAEKDGVVLLYATSRMLVVVCSTLISKTLHVVLHAPHSGKFRKAMDWWAFADKKLLELRRKIGMGLPLTVYVDANARSPAADHVRFGPAGFTRATRTTRFF